MHDTVDNMDVFILIMRVCKGWKDALLLASRLILNVKNSSIVHESHIIHPILHPIQHTHTHKGKKKTLSLSDGNIWLS